MDQSVLQPGTILKTSLGGTVKIEKFIGSGGQGSVYMVTHGGKKKALKWFRKDALGEDPKRFYDNIKQNMLRQAPSEAFLWPLDVTQWVDGTFGYVMDLRPEGYVTITDLTKQKAKMKDFKTVCTAAMKIVSAFRILHNAGYSYFDLNDGNFFINPDNGDVLICDNDNVAHDGSEVGIAGKPRYMAPEIVRGEVRPDSLTDRFSMALLLYMLFCLNHPLEGKRYFSMVALTAKDSQDVYGNNPLFMMDPDDDSNGPDPEIHKNSTMVWENFPIYMKDIFIQTFSQKALLERPSSRPAEIEWLNALTRFRSDIVSCDCGNEIFTEYGEAKDCDQCGKKADIAYQLQLRDYALPAVLGTRIYRCQLETCQEKDALDIVAQVVRERKSGALYVYNPTERHWKAVTSQGKQKTVPAKGHIPLKDGIKFEIDGNPVLIVANTNN